MLTDRGLAAAVRILASRAPVPVDIAALPAERLPPAVEIAVYFVVAEALTNVAKYARAAAATVSIEVAGGRVAVEVSDDGAGGADVAGGSGLRGLSDRVAALDGRLELDPPRRRHPPARRDTALKNDEGRSLSGLTFEVELVGLEPTTCDCQSRALPAEL